MQKIEYNLSGKKDKFNLIHYVTQTSGVFFLNQNVSSQLLFFLRVLFPQKSQVTYLTNTYF